MIREAWSVGKTGKEFVGNHKTLSRIGFTAVAIAGLGFWASSTYNSGIESEVNIGDAVGSVASAMHNIETVEMTSDLRVAAISDRVTTDVRGGNINFSKELPSKLPDISIDCGFNMESTAIIATSVFVPAEASRGFKSEDLVNIKIEGDKLLAESTFKETPETQQYIIQDGDKKYDSAGKCQNVVTALGAAGSLAGDNPVEQSVRGTLDLIEADVENKTLNTFVEGCMDVLEPTIRESVVLGVTESLTAQGLDRNDEGAPREIKVEFTDDEFTYGEQYVPVLQDEINNSKYAGSPKITMGDWEFDTVDCSIEDMVIEKTEVGAEKVNDR